MAIAAHPFIIMIIFNVDLDNTLIYSYKHDIGNEKKCVEIYEGREISFMTDKTQQMLTEISKRILVVPTTTRTVEQYSRIQLGLDEIPYALTCNGGVLLRNGIEDEQWYKESLRLVADCNQELEKAEAILAEDANRCLEVRNIRGLFIFTKSNVPEESVKALAEKLDTSLVDVFSNGIKVYVVPKKLSKGNAVKRLKEQLHGDTIIAAGDSEFDKSMLEFADVAIAPEKLYFRAKDDRYTLRVGDGLLFSEKGLEYVLGVLAELETK